MQNSSSISGDFWLPWVVVVTLVISATFGGPRGPARERPSMVEQGLGGTSGDGQRIPARMWQDPFEALKNFKAQPKSTRADGEAYRPDRIEDVMSDCLKVTASGPGDDGAGHRLHLLFVSVPSDNYPESAEKRIRIRVAVTSALSSAGCDPQSASKLGSAWIDSTPIEERRCQASESNVEVNGMELPYELFYFHPKMNRLDAGSPSSNPGGARCGFQRILVFYVPEAELQPEKQWEWLRNVQFILSNQRSGMKGETNTCIHATWLGPGSSDRLVELIKGSARVSKDITELPAGGLIPFKVRSMLPTISAPILSELSDCPNGAGVGMRFDLPLCESSKTHCPRPSSIQVIRGPCDDERLSGALVDELRLRRPGLFEGKGQVVLLSEWDTLYGRALPISFKKAFEHFRPPTNVREFTYLRGLDGQISGIVEKPTAKAAKSTELPDLAKDLMKSRAPSVAYGRTQVDYVNRLAKRLRQQLNELPGKVDVEAVGILGSDTYDKLLILQAMRDEFPGAQFFTTELDAVLSDPDQYAITRNLLIASGFGLGLAENYQRRIMPFRDAHQTAFYHATLRSVREFEPIHECRTTSEDVDSWSPVLYEVGRNGPCALPSVNPSKQAFVKSAVAGNYVTVKSGWVAAILTLAMTLGVLAICMTLNFGRAPLRATRSMLLRYVRQCREHGVKRISSMQVKRSLLICLADAPVWFFVFSVIFLIGVTVAIPITAGRPDQEPLFLSEGISSWPATWLRALAVFLAACYFWNLTTSFRRSLYAMRRTFREALGPAEAGRELTGPRRFSADFRERSLSNCLKYIVIAAFAVYMILASGLFQWLGFPAPTCRGDASRRIE